MDVAPMQGLWALPGAQKYGEAGKFSVTYIFKQKDWVPGKTVVPTVGVVQATPRVLPASACDPVLMLWTEGVMIEYH